MANTKFQIKRSSVSGRLPDTSDPANTAFIDAGELAINLADEKVYSSNGTVSFEVGANLTSISVSGNATLASIIANGSPGLDNQVLVSNGSIVYWANTFSYFLDNGGDLGSLDSSSQDAFGVSTNFSFDFNTEGFVMPIDYGVIESESNIIDFGSVAEALTNIIDFGSVAEALTNIIDFGSVAEALS